MRTAPDLAIGASEGRKTGAAVDGAAEEVVTGLLVGTLLLPLTTGARVDAAVGGRTGAVVGARVLDDDAIGAVVGERRLLTGAPLGTFVMLQKVSPV